MHLHIGVLEFLIFGMYLVIWKAFFHYLNVTARDSGSTTLAGVTGLLA